MVKINWLFNRLKAMSLPEIRWRLNQKWLERQDTWHFGNTKYCVTENIFSKDLSWLQIHPEKLCLERDVSDEVISRSVPMLAGYEYDRFRTDWHAAFQSDTRWPIVFSLTSAYKQNDGIGDPRTNWELNRHYQFPMLAKAYYVTSDKAYLDEFTELFESWETENPFLWGIAWTSVMEMAIRASNWCYAYVFLYRSNNPPRRLLEKLRVGIINMTDYIAHHYSRFSSANNHLIVEAYAIGQSGILTGYQLWIELAVSLLTRELTLQNHSDGVNREQALHYQAFSMEAYGLLLRLLVKNGIEPPPWAPLLERQCRYLANCLGPQGEVIEFGDDDEGKILDLESGVSHYQYVLELFSCLLDKRYVEMSQCTENTRWLFSEEERAKARKKLREITDKSVCFQEGGHSVLHSDDGEIIIGIDHAELGYGTIAAHAHADALSFVFWAGGRPVFIDPGTYLYGYDAKSRDDYRKTENHNTVCVNGQDQSEMLGAFLWGRKAVSTLIYADTQGSEDVIEAEHDGYLPVKVRRQFRFDRKRTFVIIDTIEGKADVAVNFVLAPTVQITTLHGPKALIRMGEYDISLTAESIGTELKWTRRSLMVSERYGTQCPSTSLRLCFKCNGQTRVKTTLYIERIAEKDTV